VQLDFDLLSTPNEHAVVQLAWQVAANLNRKIYTATTGGGSEAKILA